MINAPLCCSWHHQFQYLIRLWDKKETEAQEHVAVSAAVNLIKASNSYMFLCFCKASSRTYTVKHCLHVFLVYRLITRNSYEREMLDKASLKLGLDRAVLQSMSGNKDSNVNGVRNLPVININCQDILRLVNCVISLLLWMLSFLKPIWAG